MVAAGEISQDKPTVRSNRKGKSKGGKASLLVAMILIVMLGATFTPTTLLVVIGMMPTFAAFICDQDRKRSTTLTVGSMNAAGLVHFIIVLWVEGQTMTHSMELIRQPETTAIIYSSAAIGWLLLYSIPSVFQIFLTQRAKLRIADLEGKQASLRREWGEDVRTTPVSP